MFLDSSCTYSPSWSHNDYNSYNGSCNIPFYLKLLLILFETIVLVIVQSQMVKLLPRHCPRGSIANPARVVFPSTALHSLQNFELLVLLVVTFAIQSVLHISHCFMILLNITPSRIALSFGSLATFALMAIRQQTAAVKKCFWLRRFREIHLIPWLETSPEQL